MARRKKSSSGRTRVIYKKAQRRSRSRGSSGVSNMSLLYAGGYGALRAKLASAITPLTSKIPMGNIADEVGMLGVSWVAMKYGSGAIREAGKIGMMIESASIGQALANGTSVSNNSISYMYG